MLDTQPDTRHNRPVYFGPTFDVLRSDEIRIGGETARNAQKFGLALPVRLVAMATFKTRSTRVSWVNDLNRNARQHRFVGDEGSELKERPSCMPRSLSFPHGYPIANPSQIFDCNSTSGVLALLDDAFGDAMVLDASETGLLAPKFSEMSFCAFGSNRLKTTSKRQVLLTDRFDGIPRETLTIRVHGDVTNSEIDPEPTLRIDWAPVRDVNGYEEVELALAIDEIGLTPYALKPPSMIGPNNTRDGNTSVKCKKAYAIEPVLERVEPLIVGDSPVLVELWALGLVPLVDLAHLRDQPHGMLCGQIEALSDLTVEELLEAELVGGLKLEGFQSQPRTGLVHTHHRREETLTFLRRDE